MNALLLNPVLLRLGIVVFHALWELVLLGLLAWGVLALGRRRSAQAQYLLACGFLGAMLAAPLLTFFWVGAGTGTSPVQLLSAGEMTVSVTGLEGATLRSTLGRLSALAPWLALLWFTGAALMVARLGAGLWWLERRYLSEAHPAPECWQSALDRLGRRMGLKERVRLLESRRADSPLLIGWVKPVILVPAAAMLHLRPEALEAVLAHELAHVRRADYLANLLQSLAEALLFFHPCAWWLSGRIRELREHCCDDAAAALCGDPLILAEGLSTLEHLRRRIQPDPEPALAAAKGKLMSRITRLFRPQDLPVSQGRGLIWTLVGASLLGAAALAAQQTTAPKPPKTGATAKPAAARLSILHQPPPPPYPGEARAKGIQGAVVLNLHINTEGVPETIDAVKGPEELKAGAIAYAKGWRFKVPKGATPEFQLNLLYVMKGAGSSNLQGLLASLPGPKGPSATVEIVAAARPEETTTEGAQDFDFSKIKIRHQPPAPAYPADAKLQRVQGTVVVEITVDEAGVPVSTQALEGPPQLAPTAVEYAKAWRFEPATVNGKAVKARFKLTMPFRLREDAPAPKTSKGKVDGTPGQAQDTDFSKIKVRFQPPAPAYPAEAKESKIQGTVEVEIIVDAQGVPVGVKALSGPEELRPTAVAYAEDWRFEAFKVNGKATKARFKLTMPFRLR